MKQRYRNKLRRAERRQQALARFRIMPEAEWARADSSKGQPIDGYSGYVQRKKVEQAALEGHRNPMLIP